MSPVRGVAGGTRRIPIARWKRRWQGYQRRLKTQIIDVMQGSVDGNLFDDEVVHQDAEIAFIFWVSTCRKQPNIG